MILLSKGLTNTEVAERLGVTRQAIDNRTYVARRKLGCRTTAQLMWRCGREMR